MRPSIRPGLVALTAGLLAIVTVAAPVAAGTPLPVRHAVAIVRDPDIKGIAMLLTDDSGGGGQARVTFQDFHFVIGAVVVSHQRCGVPHDPSTGRLSIFSPRDPQSGLPTVIERRFASLLPFIEQDARFSVRVFRADPRREVACADFVRYGDAGDRTTVAGKLGNFEIQDLMSTIFDRGIVLLKLRADGIRITAALPGLPDGTYGIAGDDAPCGTPMTGTPPFGIYSSNPGGGLLGVTVEPTGDASTVESIRLFKGTGTSRPAGCSGIDTVLVPR